MKERRRIVAVGLALSLFHISLVRSAVAATAVTTSIREQVSVFGTGAEVKLKLASFQFQKYGMIQGKVLRVSADATEAPSPNTRSDALTGRDRPMGPLAYRAIVELATQELNTDGARYALSPGMQVAAEIHLGTRSVLEYVLSPVQKAFHEAGRER